MRNNLGLVPTEMPAASTERVSQFRRGRVLFPQPSRELACPIGDNNIGPSPLKSSHDLNYGLAFFQGAFLDGRLDHCILAAHMINGARFSKPLADSPQNVHVRQGRFYHHNVRSFVDIQCYLTQGFIRVGKIHLIRPSVAELGRTLGSLAKWSVESRREFRRVTHNRRLVEASLIERLANRADATVHHVAWRHNVRTSCSVRERRLHQQLDSLVVENMEMISVDACHTTVPMTHILTQADAATDAGDAGVFSQRDATRCESEPQAGRNRLTQLPPLMNGPRA